MGVGLKTVGDGSKGCSGVRVVKSFDKHMSSNVRSSKFKNVPSVAR